MPSDVAVCPSCGSIWVVLHVDGLFGSQTTYHFGCGKCGHQTPPRTDKRDADADINWKPISEVARP